MNFNQMKGKKFAKLFMKSRNEFQQILLVQLGLMLKRKSEWLIKYIQFAVVRVWMDCLTKTFPVQQCCSSIMYKGNFQEFFMFFFCSLFVSLITGESWELYEKCSGEKLADVLSNCLFLFFVMYDIRYFTLCLL